MTNQEFESRSLEVWEHLVHLLLGDVHQEREVQFQKHGDNVHLPDGTDQRLLQMAEVYRMVCDRAHERGALTWTHILLEETYEAAGEENQDRLRAELVQVMAVCAGWIEAIDKRSESNEQRAREQDPSTG